MEKTKEEQKVDHLVSQEQDVKTDGNESPDDEATIPDMYTKHGKKRAVSFPLKVRISL